MQITKSFIRVLRIVDSDETPVISYLDVAIHKARKEMIRRF